MRLVDGMSKSAVAFLAKQLAAENTHTGRLQTLFTTAVNAADPCFAMHTSAPALVLGSTTFD